MAPSESRDVDRVRETLAAYHREEVALTDADIDALLDLDPRDGRAESEDEIQHVGTPYAVCRGLFSEIDLRDGETFLDLGSGLGRVLLYGAAVLRSRRVELAGIEIVARRAEAGARAARALGLDGVRSLAGDVRAPWFAPLFERARVFYAHRPFPDDVEEDAFRLVAAQGRKRDILFVTHRIRAGRVDTDVFRPVVSGLLPVFRSRPVG